MCTCVSAPHPVPSWASSFIRHQTEAHVLRSPHVCHQSTINLVLFFFEWHRQAGRPDRRDRSASKMSICRCHSSGWDGTDCQTDFQGLRSRADDSPTAGLLIGSLMALTDIFGVRCWCSFRRLFDCPNLGTCRGIPPSHSRGAKTHRHVRPTGRLWGPIFSGGRGHMRSCIGVCLLSVCSVRSVCFVSICVRQGK